MATRIRWPSADVTKKRKSRRQDNLDGAKCHCWASVAHAAIRLARGAINSRKMFRRF
jgi:hypothetical protein